MKTFMEHVLETIRQQQIAQGHLIRGERPIRVVMYSRLERVPVKKNPLVKYSTGQLVSELTKRNAITLHSVEV